MSNEVRELIHDVRNPLNTISMNAELGKLVLQKNGDLEKALELFDIILKECRKCDIKIDELRSSVVNDEK